MRGEVVKTKVRDGGLRYESKSPGTEFPGPTGGTMSCFLCGRHVLRSKLAAFRMATGVQFRCKGGCDG